MEHLDNIPTVQEKKRKSEIYFGNIMSANYGHMGDQLGDKSQNFKLIFQYMFWYHKFITFSILCHVNCYKITYIIANNTLFGSFKNIYKNRIAVYIFLNMKLGW